MQKSIPSVLLVGAGRWGENHLRGLIKMEALGFCRLVGVQDIDEARLRYISREFRVRTFHNDEGLAEADAVDIAVPTYDHFKVAKKCLLAGKDVLVEKPLTATVAEALELEAVHASSSQILMVGHLFRYNPALDEVKKLVEEREIGNIRFMRGRFLGFRFRENDAGILATTAIHFIYLSNYLMGRLPESVWAKVQPLLDEKFDDHAVIRLDYGSGQFTIIESDCFTPGKWRTFDVIGTQGSISLNALDQKVELHQKKHMLTGERFEVYNGSVLHFPIQFEEPLTLEFKHFFKCVQEREEPMTGIREGIDVLRIIEAGYESSRSDKTVPLPAK